MSEKGKPHVLCSVIILCLNFSFSPKIFRFANEQVKENITYLLWHFFFYCSSLCSYGVRGKQLMLIQSDSIRNGNLFSSCSALGSLRVFFFS